MQKLKIILPQWALTGCKISWRTQLGSCDIPHAVPNRSGMQNHKQPGCASRELWLCLQRSFPGQAGLITFAASVPSWSNDPWLRKSGLSWIVAPQLANLFRGKVHQKWESCLSCWVGFFCCFFGFLSLLCDLWGKNLLLMSSALLCPSEVAGALCVGWSHSRI